MKQSSTLLGLHGYFVPSPQGYSVPVIPAAGKQSTYELLTFPNTLNTSLTICALEIYVMY